jgi:hypothetical protein
LISPHPLFFFICPCPITETVSIGIIFAFIYMCKPFFAPFSHFYSLPPHLPIVNQPSLRQEKKIYLAKDLRK